MSDNLTAESLEILWRNFKRHEATMAMLRRARVVRVQVSEWQERGRLHFIDGDACHKALEFHGIDLRPEDERGVVLLVCNAADKKIANDFVDDWETSRSCADRGRAE